MLNRPFFMYKDFCKEKKLKNGFPITDKGVDLIDESSNIIGQCKYYSKNTSITYSKLSTFLATEKITGKKLDFYLIRTDDCKIDGLVKKMMDRKILNDVCISRDEFLFYIDDIDK